jgi:hypothetical protein
VLLISSWALEDLHSKLGLTIASSEQEAASTLVLIVETVSRCLLSLTQAFGRRYTPNSRWVSFPFEASLIAISVIQLPSLISHFAVWG